MYDQGQVTRRKCIETEQHVYRHRSRRWHGVLEEQK